MGLIYGLAGVRGLIDAVEGPMRQTFVPEMVGTEDLLNAIALNSTQFNAARIVGPAIGAVVAHSAVGFAACFYINAASFLAVIIALLAMRVTESCIWSRACPGSRVLGQLREGLRYAALDPDVVVILIVMGALRRVRVQLHHSHSAGDQVRPPGGSGHPRRCSPPRWASARWSPGSSSPIAAGRPNACCWSRRPSSW